MAIGTPDTPHTYPHGVTSWIDTEQPDIEAAVSFYGDLLGWSFTEAMPEGAPGSYRIAALDGHDAAAIAPAESPDAVPRWNTYVAVDDADATAEAIARAGGQVVVAPVDAGPGGRMAVVRDPQGAEFRLWQAKRRLGSQINNVPGSWNFSDLYTSDPDVAQPFYAEVFGWRFVDLDTAPGQTIVVPGYGDHLESTVDPDIRKRQAGAPPEFADAIGGMVTVDAGEAPHWRVTIAVKSRDAVAAHAERLGATVLSTARAPWAFTARVRDPQGAEFTISEFAPPDDWQ